MITVLGKRASQVEKLPHHEGCVGLDLGEKPGLETNSGTIGRSAGWDPDGSMKMKEKNGPGLGHRKTPMMATKGSRRLGRKVSKKEKRDFPGSPVFNGGCADSIPGQGAKMPHALQPKDQNVNNRNRTFLVVQCLRILLPMQGTMGSIPGPGRSRHRAPEPLGPQLLKPMCHNYWATERACSREKPPPREVRAPQLEKSPLSNEDQAQPINK